MSKWCIDCYNHCLPIADTDDCTEGVTVTVIGVLDDPSVILTITSTRRNAWHCGVSLVL